MLDPYNEDRATQLIISRSPADIFRACGQRISATHSDHSWQFAPVLCRILLAVAPALAAWPSITWGVAKRYQWCWLIPRRCECHYGVPMCQAVLHAINTRLTPRWLLFSLIMPRRKLCCWPRIYAGYGGRLGTWVKPLLINMTILSLTHQTKIPARLIMMRLWPVVTRILHGWCRVMNGMPYRSIIHRGRLAIQRCGLSPPWGLFAGTGECVDGIYGQTCCLFMDIAHVSLQWLVFSMDLSAITGTHVCLRQVRDELIWHALAT